MKTLSLVLGLLAIAHSVDVWTSFVNEEGLEYDMAQAGVELANSWSSTKGGSGGGAWSDDCSSRGGLTYIQTTCGKYVGAIRLHCKSGGWLPRRGAGRGNGAGGTANFNAVGITKVQINAGSYVDKAIFYKGNSAVKTCGWSNGGGRYTARAPNGYTLCAMSGGAGWWMDRLRAGWCKPPCSWRPSGGCNKKCGGGSQKWVCGSQSKNKSCNTQKCPVDCKWKSFGSYGKCSALCDGGSKRRTRGKTGPFYGGKACSGSSQGTTSCNSTPCYKITNCGTLAQIYAKTKGKLLGQITQGNKNLGTFNEELKMAQDEVDDGVKLLALIKTLPNSSSKSKIQGLVEKCLADARKALAALKSKIASEKAKVSSAQSKVNKLEHSAASCKCDAQARQMRPLVQRATQKIADNRKAIDAIDKMLASLLALNKSFQAKIDGFAWIKSFGGGLYDMMTKTFRDMIARTTTTINALKAKRKVSKAYNTEWDKKIAGYNKQMSDCSAKVAELAKKLKLVLQEIGMMDIWQEFAQEFDDLAYTVVEDEEEEIEAVEEAEMFAEEEEEVESSESSAMQNVFAAVMVFGGLGAFVMGKRTSKYTQYESLV